MARRTRRVQGLVCWVRMVAVIGSPFCWHGSAEEALWVGVDETLAGEGADDASKHHVEGLGTVDEVRGPGGQPGAGGEVVDGDGISGAAGDLGGAARPRRG